MKPAYTEHAPLRTEIDAMMGAVVVEFGASWCTFCQASQQHVEAAMAEYPNVEHLRFEDGKGRILGRTFAVKLWPTLVFLHNGQEVTRLVRPTDVSAIKQALAQITTL